MKHTIEIFRESLAYCTVCKCGEGELTTDCCGRRLTEEERHRVYKVGSLDFVGEEWIEKKQSCRKPNETG